MTIQVTGVLVNPLNQPSEGTIIRVTAQSNDGSMIGLTGSVITGSDGSYDFELVDGEHLIEIHFSDEYIVSGVVEVNNTLPDPIELPDLMDYVAE